MFCLGNPSESACNLQIFGFNLFLCNLETIRDIVEQKKTLFLKIVAIN